MDKIKLTCIIKTAALTLISCSLFSCQKGFLDAKPNKSLVVPSTLNDLQALLDYTDIMNGNNTIGAVSALGELASDDYYLLYKDWQGRSDIEKNSYIWGKKVYNGNPVKDWSFVYRQVFYANVALEGLAKVDKNPATEKKWNNIKGSALFYRAHAFYQVAQVFAPPYNKNNASTDLGIPLRLNADPTEKSVRSTIEETYSRIISDLHEALLLLPIEAEYKTRPSKAAAFALLSRVYLAMENYDKALESADSCLQLVNKLLDYNDLNPDKSYPIPKFNDEVIYQCTIQRYITLLPSRAKVDSLLYQSYEANDLRKNLFFKQRAIGEASFRGSYYGSSSLFGGLAKDEVYLTRAECYARKGNKEAAMKDLNTLLRTRWKTGTFVSLTAPNADEALKQILTERRKELLFRGTRWTDLRRLNQDPLFAITQKRVLDGQTYTLPPNDLRYVFPIPDEVMEASPMPQNPR